MASDQPSDNPGADPGATYDTLRRLERRLDEASRAAERLIAQAAGEAARAATGGGRAEPETPTPPPAGWQIPAPDGAASSNGSGERDLELLAQILHSLRDLIPPELQRRVAEALREVLLALRALIDWYLERSEQRRSEPVQVQDIPIV